MEMKMDVRVKRGMKMEIDIPDELAQFEPDLRYFVQTMVNKLHVNRHKGFGEGTYWNLWQGLEGEMKEMWDARKESQFAFMLEGVDVANFAFILALKAIKETKPDFKANTAMTPDSRFVNFDSHDPDEIPL